MISLPPRTLCSLPLHLVNQQPRRLRRGVKPSTRIKKRAYFQKRWKKGKNYSKIRISIMMKYIRALHIIYLSVHCIFLLGFMYYSLFFIGSSNHVSVNITVVSLCIIGSSIVCFFVRKLVCDSFCITINNLTFVVIVLTLFVILLFDWFNILVYYDIWIKRGMPSKYTFKMWRKLKVMLLPNTGGLHTAALKISKYKIHHILER